MRSLTEHLNFAVPARVRFLSITGDAEDLVRRSGIQEGTSPRMVSAWDRA